MAEEKVNTDNVEESEIDLLELASKLWVNRRRLIKWSIWGAVIGLIVAFSIPKEYNTTVSLSPEISADAQGGGLNALASLAGLNMGDGATDAMNPMLYPDVVNSLPFVTDLFDVEIRTCEGETMTLQQFMKRNRRPWWSVIIGFPSKLLGMILPKDDVKINGTPSSTESKYFRLNKKQTSLVESLRARVVCDADPKTFMITINVDMQDPLVSATVADTVVNRLQEFITAYRTSKAREDLEYCIKINEEARQAYYAAQQTYADYLDKNQGIAFRSSQLTQERLQNEAALAFSLYNQTAQQVQMAEAKVQEKTPVYAVIDPPTVPLKASKPRKVLILIGWTFLAFVACSVWILFGKTFVQKFKQNFKVAEKKAIEESQSEAPKSDKIKEEKRE